MSYHTTHFSKVENIGLIDSAIRGSLGMAILLSILLIPAISSSLLVALTLVAIYAGLTAFLSWDPLYALVMGSHYQLPQKVSANATIAASSVAHEFNSGGHYKKAA